MALSDPADKAVDVFQPTVSHRAGYTNDKLAWVERWARKGGTLASGEGLILVQELDRLRAIIAASHTTEEA